MTNREYRESQAIAIANILQAKGYSVGKLPTALTWEITKGEWHCILCFIPRPVEAWQILPAGSDDNREEIYSLIEQTIGGRR